MVALCGQATGEKLSKEDTMLQKLSQEPVVSFASSGQVLELPLEEYLRGVLPAEMPASWPPEALKAQAVAARTYALHALSHPRHKGAHLCAGEHCQVWRPRHDRRTDTAIEATAGQALFYRGEPICAMYAASCGGHTDDGPEPYLRGVPCPVRGPRLGHGLGLCQFGARALAEQGLSWEAILGHFYAHEEVDAAVEEALRAAAWQAQGAAVVPGAALLRLAREQGLGAPLGPERDVAIEGRTYRLQPFALGIVYAPVGQWAQARLIRW
jgi:peptidoglycan hydrolase-like amidase